MGMADVDEWSADAEDLELNELPVAIRAAVGLGGAGDVGDVGDVAVERNVRNRFKSRLHSKGVSQISGSGSGRLAGGTGTGTLGEINRRITDLKVEGPHLTDLQSRVNPLSAISAISAITADNRRDSNSTVSTYYGSMRSADLASSRRSSGVSGVSSHRPSSGLVIAPGSFYDPISPGSSRRSSQQSNMGRLGSDVYSTSNLVLQTQNMSLQQMSPGHWTSGVPPVAHPVGPPSSVLPHPAATDSRRMSEPCRTVERTPLQPPPRPHSSSMCISPLGPLPSLAQPAAVPVAVPNAVPPSVGRATPQALTPLLKQEKHPNQEVALEEVGEGEMLESKLVIPDEMEQYLEAGNLKPQDEVCKNEKLPACGNFSPRSPAEARCQANVPPPMQNIPSHPPPSHPPPSHPHPHPHPHQQSPHPHPHPPVHAYGPNMYNRAVPSPCAGHSGPCMHQVNPCHAASVNGQHAVNGHGHGHGHAAAPMCQPPHVHPAAPCHPHPPPQCHTPVHQGPVCQNAHCQPNVGHQAMGQGCQCGVMRPNGCQVGVGSPACGNYGGAARSPGMPYSGYANMPEQQPMGPGPGPMGPGHQAQPMSQQPQPLTSPAAAATAPQFAGPSHSQALTARSTGSNTCYAPCNGSTQPHTHSPCTSQVMQPAFLYGYHQSQCSQRQVQCRDISQSQASPGQAPSQAQAQAQSQAAQAVQAAVQAAVEANVPRGMRQDAYQRTLEYVQQCQSWVDRGSDVVSSSTHPASKGRQAGGPAAGAGQAAAASQGPVPVTPASNMIINDMSSSLTALLEENRIYNVFPGMNQ